MQRFGFLRIALCIMFVCTPVFFPEFDNFRLDTLQRGVQVEPADSGVSMYPRDIMDYNDLKLGSGRILKASWEEDFHLPTSQSAQLMKAAKAAEVLVLRPPHRERSLAKIRTEESRKSHTLLNSDVEEILKEVEEIHSSQIYLESYILEKESSLFARWMNEREQLELLKQRIEDEMLGLAEFLKNRNGDSQREDRRHTGNHRISLIIYANLRDDLFYNLKKRSHSIQHWKPGSSDTLLFDVVGSLSGSLSDQSLVIPSSLEFTGLMGAIAIVLPSNSSYIYSGLSPPKRNQTRKS